MMEQGGDLARKITEEIIENSPDGMSAMATAITSVVALILAASQEPQNRLKVATSVCSTILSNVMKYGSASVEDNSENNN